MNRCTHRRGGIYQIKLNDGRAYIGSAVDFARRFKEHRRRLRRGTHHNIALQRAWNKYGEDAFSFEVRQVVDLPENLISVEQAHLDAAKPVFNIAKVAGSVLGLKHSAEAKAGFRERMIGSKLRLGKPFSAEAKVRLSLQRRGKQSAAQRAHLLRMIAGNIGRDRKSTRLNSSHIQKSRMPSSA